MEKDRSSKVIALIALFVGVVGLSLGFAAYTTTLKIDTAANVSTGGTNWNVGFSTDGTTIEDVTTARTKAANEQGNPGVIDVTKYTIGQNTNATLSTTTGSSVSYNLSILNKGNLTAYLDSVNFDNVTLTCTNSSSNTETQVDGVTGAGTTRTGANTSTISNTDCAKMFNVTLSIAGTTYTATNTPSPSGSIAASGNAPVVLTVSYKDDADARTVAATLDGDIIVTIGSISVVYTSTNPSVGN